MAKERIFCNACGHETEVDTDREFFFCPECGNKVILSRPVPVRELSPQAPEKEASPQDSEKEASKDYLTEKLKEVEFYYSLSHEKKEYEKTDSDPVYYLKGQDLLLELSTQFPDDYRVWWELCKPVDFLGITSGSDIKNANFLNYSINENYFDKALDKAELSKKKMLIDKCDEYAQKKEALRKNIEEEREKARLEKEAEARLAYERQLQEERRKREEEQRKIEEEQRRREEEQRKIEEEQRRREEEQRQREEEQRRRKEEEQRKRKEEEQQKREEAQRRREEAQRRKKEEQIQKQQQEEEERIQKQKRDAEAQIKKQQREEENKALREIAKKTSVELWDNLKSKNYSDINNTFFSFELEGSQTIVALFKNVSGIMYINSFRIDGTKRDTVFKEQSMAIQFDENGYGVKFDKKPIKIKGFEPPDNILQVFRSSDNLMVNGIPLRTDAEYIKKLTMSSKKPLISFSKVFI